MSIPKLPRRHRSLPFVLLLLSLTVTPTNAQPVNFLYFDSYAPGTRVEYQYAEQGVRFLNDFAPGRFYRSSPTIRALPGAHSSPNVLVNESYDGELYSSANVPMVIFFDQPTTGVGMWLGTPDTFQTCVGSALATVRIYDCHGTMLDQAQAAVSTTFNTSLQIIDPYGSVTRVEIDYGESACMEAIDDLGFQFSGEECEDPTVPIVDITSHAESQIVSSASQTISGHVDDPGGIASVKLNGAGMQFYKSEGLYHFAAPVTLQEGSNTLTALAEDYSGNKGSDQAILTLNTPASVQLGQFHLTQRGVMLDTPCDVDGPFVAGKSTLARILLNVQTAGGASTYVPDVELRLWRNDGGWDTLVDTLQGWSYAPVISGFSSPSHMSGVHFWIPGDTVDTAGAYKFEFQAYVGSTPVGPPILANCGGTYLSFYETKPLNLLILPLEAGVHSPRFFGTDHGQKYFGQLDALARTFPVRDGYSYRIGDATGVHYAEAQPLRLCDGTPATQSLEHCDGTGWTWDFIDTDPSGQLLRGHVVPVLGQPGTQICDGNNAILGGREVDDTTHAYAFSSALGVYRGGAHPSWQGAKHSIPLDEDHDGTIDIGDLGHYIAEFFDEQTQQWSQNLANFDRGQPGQPSETFRFFIDQDGDNCNDSKVEPQADIRTLWENQQSLLWGPTVRTLTAYNDTTPGTVDDMQLASLWLPQDMITTPEFGNIGPGQGSSPGKLSWIQVQNLSNLPHELGHNVGGFDDLYRSSIDPLPDDLVTKESAWATYVGHQSVAPAQMFATMGSARALDRVVFHKPNYFSLFSKLLVSGSKAADEPRAILSQQQFMVQGRITAENEVVGGSFRLTTGLEPDAPGEGPYALIFGSGDSVLQEFPFAMVEEAAPPEGYEEWPMPWAPFRVVAPCPVTTDWVELTYEGELIGRVERSPNPPAVTLIAPNGGETFGGEDVVTVHWESTDADGGSLQNTLYYSPDGGESWTVVISGVEDNYYEWNLAAATGTPFGSGLLRIVVSDGFNSGEDFSDGFFEVEGKSPIAMIHEPQPERNYLQCERVQLRGTADDPEGLLSAVTWYLDEEPTATGDSHDLGRLSPGPHVIHLLVTDLEGGWTVDEVSIHVVADSDCDGMSDEFEAQYGTDPGNVSDALLDPDQDSLVNFLEAWYGTAADDPDSDGDGYTDGDEAQNGSDPTQPDSIPNVDRDDDGFTTHAGDCDDDNERTYPEAPEWNDGVDNQCPEEPGYGVVDEISGNAVFGPGNERFSWPAQQGAQRYEVVRSATRWMDPPCEVDQPELPFVTDPESPEPGEVFHYVIRPVVPHLGSWGQTSSGAEREGVCP